MGHDYTFRKLTRADFPLMRGWLEQPHVAEWWGDVDAELRLIRMDLRGEEVDGRIVELDGKPFAYVQDYDAPKSGSPQYQDLPKGSRAMDTFLGDPAYLGQGHAVGYLSQRARALVDAGAPLVAVDPSPENRRAIAAYGRAGFRFRRRTISETGDPVDVMTFS